MHRRYIGSKHFDLVVQLTDKKTTVTRQAAEAPLQTYIDIFLDWPDSLCSFPNPQKSLDTNQNMCYNITVLYSTVIFFGM